MLLALGALTSQSYSALMLQHLALCLHTKLYHKTQEKNPKVFLNSCTHLPILAGPSCAAGTGT